MRHRLTFVLGAATALALAAGAAWAALPTTVDSETVIDVGDAGTVTVAAASAGLEVTAVEPAPGWAYEIEVAAGLQVEVDFRNGPRRIQFDAEIEDGQIRARVRERIGADVGDPAPPTTTDDSIPGGDDSTSTTIDEATSTTAGETIASTVDDSTSTTVDDATSTTTGDASSTTFGDDHGPAGSGSDTFTVGDVATVSIAWADGQMSLVSVSAADGWQVERQELRSDRVKIEFESESGDARFEADFHSGSIRVKTRVD